MLTLDDLTHNMNQDLMMTVFKVPLALCCFLKEMDTFVREFLSVVQRLPSCIATLQVLSRLPLPTTFSELQHFCSTNEAKFQQLRRSDHNSSSTPLGQHEVHWNVWLQSLIVMTGNEK